MDRERPRYILFAGVNGAGKSTLYKSKLWTRDEDDKELPRVNPDEILVSHRWDPASTKAQIEAGKEAVRLVAGHLAARRSFNQESTLSGRTIVRTVQRAKENDHLITLQYVGVATPEVALARILNRVKRGGHDIPRDDVIRRAASSSKNLRHVIPLCDHVNIFDNTEYLRLIASFKNGALAQYESFPTVPWVDELVRDMAENSQGNGRQ